MPSQECERNLQILDLRWYLFCGVDIQSDMLEGYIHSVPEAYRDIIRERLNRWFSIPIQHRTNILANVKTFAFHRQVGGNAARGKGPGAPPREMSRQGKPFDAKTNSFPFPHSSMGGGAFSYKGFPFFYTGRQGPPSPPASGKGRGGGLGAPKDVSDFRMGERRSYPSKQGDNPSHTENKVSTDNVKPPEFWGGGAIIQIEMVFKKLILKAVPRDRPRVEDLAPAGEECLGLKDPCFLGTAPVPTQLMKEVPADGVAQPSSRMCANGRHGRN